MAVDISPPQCRTLDDFVVAFETARARDADADLAAFLPERSHFLYAEVLRELIRIDLEFAWEHAGGRSVEQYLARFPEVRADRRGLQEIAFEEYRLRLQAGEAVTPAEYERRLGISVTGWPVRLGERPADEFAKPASELRGETDSPPLQREVESSELLGNLQSSTAREALRFADAVGSFPQPGAQFLGFRLIAELGRGAFARVYLAEQLELAGRRVALKVSTQTRGEPHRLAQLQHTNIVPIYSVHQATPFQAICMPYFGSTTLADVLRGLRGKSSLPGTGVQLVSTLLESSNRNPPVGVTSPPLGPAIDASKRFTANLELLERMSYVEAVLWLGVRLADGLAHAHERGIVHRDLKPANVLLADDGQPMLLDFNLSAEARPDVNAAAASMGGTLQYMAPEHLQAFQGTGSPQAVDARSDVYALGVILFELLTGRHPFSAPGGTIKEVLRAMIDERRLGAPNARDFNKTVSPAVAAILRRCLAPIPAQRYQGARQLREDLQRHLDHLPLQHTPEPSLVERMAKWTRRHPRLASAQTLVALAAVLLLGSALGLVWHGREVARQEAADNERALLRRERENESLENARIARETDDNAQAFLQEAREVEFQLSARTADIQQVAEGAQRGERTLGRFQVLDESAWWESKRVTQLLAEDRIRVREAAADVLLLLARAAVLQAPARADDPQRAAALQRALEFNERAEAASPAPHKPHILWVQRAELATLRGNAAEAGRCMELARRFPPRTAQDHYWLGSEAFVHGRYVPARGHFQSALDLDPRHFGAWFMLGLCHYQAARDADAVACYGTCIALRPDFARSYFNRGLVQARMRKYGPAIADFDKAAGLLPEHSDIYLNRALARLAQGELAEKVQRSPSRAREEYLAAENDLTRALELRATQTRIYFIRNRVREQLGDKAGAAEAFATGMAQTPQDEFSYLARGDARLRSNHDLLGALADYREAAVKNPRSLAALQNQARVHAILGRLEWGLTAVGLTLPGPSSTGLPLAFGGMGDAERAVELLNTAVGLYPDYVRSRAGRGVLLARLGRREAALRDAEDCLRRSAEPETLYQVADIYALTSRTHPGDRLQAFQLLRRALKGGFGHLEIETDPDLAPIRDHAEYKRILDAARELELRPTLQPAPK